MREDGRPETVGELFSAPRRTGVHDDHRFVAVSEGNGQLWPTTFCRDCGYRQPHWSEGWVEAIKPPKCEPDKYRPGWVIHTGRGGFITRDVVSNEQETT